MPLIHNTRPKLDFGKNKPKSQQKLLDKEKTYGTAKTKSMINGIAILSSSRGEMDTTSKKNQGESREEKVKKVIQEIEEVMKYQGGNAKNQLLRVLKNKLTNVSSKGSLQSEEDEQVIIDVIREFRENANNYRGRDFNGNSKPMEDKSVSKKELIINVPVSSIERMDPCHNIIETYETAIPLKRCEGYSDVSMTPVRVNNASPKKWTVKSSAVEYYQPMCNQSNTDLTENGFNSIRLPMSYERGQKLIKTYSVADCTSQSRVQQLTMFWNQVLGPELNDESKKENCVETTPSKEDQSREEFKGGKSQMKKKEEKSKKTRIKKKMPYFPVVKEHSPTEQTKRPVFCCRKVDNFSIKNDKRCFNKSKAKINLLGKEPVKTFDITIPPSREPSTYITKISLDSESSESEESDTIGTVYHAEVIKDPKEQNTCVVKMNQELIMDEELSLSDIIATLEKLQTILQNSPCKNPEELPVPSNIKKKIVDLVVSTQEMTSKPSSDFFCLKFPWEKRIFVSPQTGNLIGYMKKDFSRHTVRETHGPYTSYEHNVTINSGVAVFINPVSQGSNGNGSQKQRKVRSPATLCTLPCFYSTVSSPPVITLSRASSAGGDSNKSKRKRQKKSKRVMINVINLAPSNYNRPVLNAQTNTEDILFNNQNDQFYKTDIPVNENKVSMRKNINCTEGQQIICVDEVRDYILNRFLEIICVPAHLLRVPLSICFKSRKQELTIKGKLFITFFFYFITIMYILSWGKFHKNQRKLNRHLF